MSPHLRGIAALVLGLTLALTGCGGSDSDATSEGSDTTADAGPAASAQVCPGPLDPASATAVTTSSDAPVFVDGQYAALVDDQLVVGAAPDALAPLDLPGFTGLQLSLVGAVEDDLLVSTEGEDDDTVRVLRIGTAGDVAWDVTLDDAAFDVDLDPALGVLEIESASDGDDRFLSVGDGSEVDVPEPGLDDLTLQDGDEGLVRLQASDTVAVWGDLSFEGNDRLVITDLDQDDRRELTQDAAFTSDLCAATIYTVVPGGTALDVYDASATDQDPTLAQSIELPGPAADPVGLVVGPGYVAVRGDDDVWTVLTP